MARHMAMKFRRIQNAVFRNALMHYGAGIKSLMGESLNNLMQKSDCPFAELKGPMSVCTHTLTYFRKYNVINNCTDHALLCENTLIDNE